MYLLLQMNAQHWVAPLFAVLIFVASFSKSASVAVILAVVLVLAAEFSIGGSR